MFVRRWSLRSKMLAILAVVAGAGSFAIVRGYAAEVEALRPAAGEVVTVVVADRDLARGSVIGADAVRLERMPSAFAPPGAFRTAEEAVGRTLASDLAAGEAVTADARRGRRWARRLAGRERPAGVRRRVGAPGRRPATG